MEITINVNVHGLEGFAQALLAMANNRQEPDQRREPYSSGRVQVKEPAPVVPFPAQETHNTDVMSYRDIPATPTITPAVPVGVPVLGMDPMPPAIVPTGAAVAAAMIMPTLNLAQAPVAPVSVAPTPVAPTPVTAVPVAAAPTYTFEQLALATSPLIDAGRGDELRQLLTKYNVQMMTELKPELYGAFATDLRALGARI